MTNRNPMIWARVDAELLSRINTEAKRLFEGNQSMLLRKAIEFYLDEIERRQRQAIALTMAVEAEREAVA